MTTRQDILALNKQQKRYYEARYDAYQAHHDDLSSASWFTNLWWRARESIAEADNKIGIDKDILELHKHWLGDIGDRSILDFGCFTGNPLSLWLAKHAAKYRGIDLSEKAIAELNGKLALLDRPDAAASCTDILNNKFPDSYFDVIYAKSVLHHFSDISIICEELNRLLKPGGIVISDDPIQTEPINRIARVIYRPFQSDRDWEWPFTRKTIKTFQVFFEIRDMQGFRGFSRLALPFFFLPQLRQVGVQIGKWGWKLDRKMARSQNLFLFFCWNITFLMKKPKIDR